MSRRGRPPLSDDEGSTPVSVKLPDSLYDRAYARASDDRVSVPEVIRRALVRDLETQNRRTR
jgi:Arc/MetJ-type ribon-helix-helix transcriptional regulator